MSNYVDGFIAPVPKKNLDAYKAISEKAGKIWMEYGAISYVECVADDVESGELTSFPQSVNLEKDEVVIFSWITYNSREHRDEVLDKVMSDPRMEAMENEEMPFDGKRMMWGGFKKMIDLGE
ncbi:RNA signal recognition particle [Halobacteriovorax marinus]|uniref:RNA signal recognition particle n=1 Tax=Halobacteriovorax marinus (strain ATCC BAA-682 / DSM 15412 / SJ) TaxID=862908 RepID=E1WZE7_HALMS|nr:DUF1428 domain-containing protein [Halobacteriovorax marinus]ATH09122.1 RNA signal recognition particle [Halobacteriovorax marinus]CBW27835.1 conserved hypothetical protein [Halobacteriovorax marinus SJ]